MPIESYDDDDAIRAYILTNFVQLMTALERRVYEYGPLVSSINNWKAQRLYTMCEERDGHVPDSDVIAACEVERSVFIDRAVARIRLNHSEKLNLNRCPRCNRVPRTLKARQCPWCFASWRD